VGSPTLAEGPFRVVAEREFPLRGPAERVVSVRIGVPEPDAQHPGTFRCPFQVTGLSDDSVQHAYGVDSFQALNLALVGVRHFIKTNASSRRFMKASRSPGRTARGRLLFQCGCRRMTLISYDGSNASWRQTSGVRRRVPMIDSSDSAMWPTMKPLKDALRLQAQMRRRASWS
jgi:hypothetical protein